jgi:Cu/Ag efflux pump CusA
MRVLVVRAYQERYGVNVRYRREFRDNVHALRRVLVPPPSGAQVPMAQIADLKLLEGPSMIRDENGQLAGYVFVDMAGRDVGGYVQEAKARVQERLDLPAGYTLVWSGQYENLARVQERLKVMIPALWPRRSMSWPRRRSSNVRILSRDLVRQSESAHPPGEGLVVEDDRGALES